MTKSENTLKKILLKYNVILLLPIILLLPMFYKGYVIRFSTTIFMYIALAQAWNIIGGFTGYISLGIMGPVGLGGYLTAILMINLGFPFFIAAVIAALITMLFFITISAPILRLKSGYFAIATFAVAYILREISNNATQITGGGMGLMLPMRPGTIDESNLYFFYLMLAIAIITTLVVSIISKSRLGYGLLAVKEDEEAANVLGVNTKLYKVIAFGISSFFAGLIGSAYAYWLVFIDPATLFNQNLSILIIAMVLVGGGGTVYGPVIGTILISAISELFWNRFLTLHQGFMGMILILIILFIPKGIAVIFKQRDKETGIIKSYRKYLRELDQYRV